MNLLRSLSILCLSSILLSCGGGDGKAEGTIEKEAKESADKAAEKSFEKLNKSEEDTAKNDTTGD